MSKEIFYILTSKQKENTIDFLKLKHFAKNKILIKEQVTRKTTF